MQINMPPIPLREVLHFLGWRGTPIQPELIAQIEDIIRNVRRDIKPRIVIRRFALDEKGTLVGTNFSPRGGDVSGLLAPCQEAALLAATLGVQSERMLLKAQAKDPAQALLLDAVLSAAIETVCDAQEEALRAELAAQGLYLTDRFSPGYGDMPLAQSGEICAVLSAEKTLGLTVSHSGIMIPRKSVTAIMGISRKAVARRQRACEACNARDTCALRKG